MTAKEEDDLPTRAEVEQIINDERIPWDVRRDLALQYIDYIEDEDPDEVGFASDEDKNGFRNAIKSQMKISEGDINGNNFWGGMLSDTQLINSLEDSVQVAYGNAKGYVDKFAEEGRQANQKANADARAGLDQMASKATDTNPAAETSDQILDFGNPSFKNIEIFVPLYNRSVAVVRGGSPADSKQLRELYDQQRKIPFGKFAAGADEFTKLRDAVATSSGDVSGEMKKNLGGWEGAAADQARTYQQNYEAKTKVVSDGADHAAVAMMTAAGSVAKFCRAKADWMIKASCDRLGEVTPQDLDRIIRIAELGDNASQDDFKHCSKFLDQASRDMINDDDCDLDEETINHIIEQVKDYLSGTFNPFYTQYLKDFTTMCANTHAAVAGAWQGLTDFFSKLEENPFGNLDAAAGSSNGGFKTGGGSDSGGGGRTGGAGPGTGGGGGSTTPIGDTKPPAPPEIPDPNINPVTHKPLEVDPQTGEAYPIDPRTGEAIKPEAAETVTVEQGDHKISMAEPGEDGKMGISVEDGTGQPKDYKLDFGDSRPLPDATPEHGPGGDAAGGAIHRDTAERQEAAQAADQAFKPGPDGKIHIEDGNLKITAERPDGPDGPTRVTVDDGSGKPTTYTLGEDTPNAKSAAVGPTTDSSPDAAAPVGRHATEAAPGQPVEAVAKEHAEASSQHGGGHQPEPPQQSGSHGAQQYAAASADTMDAPAAVAEQQTAPAAASESTSPQSLSNPFGDDGPDGASDPAGAGGGGASVSSTAGLGSAPGGGVDQTAQPVAGMGMMGGGMMGGAGAGGGGGGDDQQRNSTAYRVDGGLFDTATSSSRISGSLDDDGVIGFR